MNALLLGAPLTMLGACAPTNTFVTLQDAAKAFPRAQYQILGKTRNDQVWISKTIEAEVAGFGFARPAKRPASWDAHTTAVMHKVPVTALPKVKPTVANPIANPEPTQEAQQPSAQPSAPSATQRLKDKIKALNDKVRKLEGR